MIHYSVRCDKGHEFEGWFQSSDAFDRQARRKLVTCPQCGSHKVAKAPMAPAVATSKPSLGGGADSKAAQLREALVEMRGRVEEHCDYVGDRFAEEARKIHHEEVEARGIYGEATDDEARELSDEGVTFSRMPWVRRADG